MSTVRGRVRRNSLITCSLNMASCTVPQRSERIKAPARGLELCDQVTILDKSPTKVHLQRGSISNGNCLPPTRKGQANLQNVGCSGHLTNEHMDRHWSWFLSVSSTALTHPNTIMNSTTQNHGLRPIGKFPIGSLPSSPSTSASSTDCQT